MDDYAKTMRKRKLIKKSMRRCTSLFKNAIKRGDDIASVMNRPSFSCADLSSLDAVEGEVFSNIDFTKAIVNGVLFVDCTFINCSFIGSSMRHVRFRSCKLKATQFSLADLNGVNFEECALEECDFTKADISSVTFTYRTSFDTCLFDEAFECRKGAVLAEDLIVYKSARAYKKKDLHPNHPYSVNPTWLNYTSVVVELKIPAGAVVIGPNGKKFRTNMAEVVDILKSDGKPFGDSDAVSLDDLEVCSAYSIGRDGPIFTYAIGDKKVISDFCLDYREECAGGIHFFKTFGEADRFCA